MHYARLAQLVERTAFNRMVVGSSPTEGNYLLIYFKFYHMLGWPSG